MELKAKRKTIIITALLLIGGAVFFLAYKFIDPSEAVFMPKCFTYTAFGIRCPGCGTQRAIHSLFNGDIVTALSFNPLIALSVPYVILLVYMEWLGGGRKYPRFHEYISGRKAIWVILIIMVIYTLIRNYFDF